jgi:hypothetical protein
VQSEVAVEALRVLDGPEDRPNLEDIQYFTCELGNEGNIQSHPSRPLPGPKLAVANDGRATC